jgi:hypothetical protein
LLALDTLHAYLVVLEALRGIIAWPAGRVTTQLSFADWFIRPGEDLYSHIANYPALLLFRGRATRILRAHVASPGFISVEGGEALSRIVDILHKGGLEKEQIAAVTRRIEAETELIEAQVIEKQIANLTAAAELMKSVGLSDMQIRSWLLAEPRLPSLLGTPLTELRSLQELGSIQDVTDEEPPEY